MCSGNCGCFKLNIQMQIAYWMVQCMHVCLLVGTCKILFSQKSAYFSSGDYCVNNFSDIYKLSGFNRISKGEIVFLNSDLLKQRRDKLEFLGGITKMHF